MHQRLFILIRMNGLVDIRKWDQRISNLCSTATMIYFNCIVAAIPDFVFMFEPSSARF